jgi:hypothetical protein
MFNSKINHVKKSMEESLCHEEVSNICFSVSLIIKEFFTGLGINSEIVIGYLSLEDDFFLRHVWCEVDGKILDASVKDLTIIPTYLRSLPDNYTGELLVGDTPSEIKSCKDFEESLRRYTVGLPMDKYYPRIGIKVYNRLRKRFNETV